MINFKTLSELSSVDSRVIPSKDQLFSMKIGTTIVHSLYSPAKEAQRLVEPLLELERDKTLVIILGAGLGYHIELLEREGFQKLVVIERNPSIFEVFQRVYKTADTHYLITPDDPVEKIDSVFSLLEIQSIKNIKTIVLRGGYDKALYRAIEDRIERVLKVKLGDFTTRLKFEELWFINIVKNIPNLKKSYPVRQILYQNIGLPIMIISAGPSLKNSLPSIREVSDYCLTIAVDTALLPLYEAQIVPDFVYSLDSQIHNIYDFSMIDHTYLQKTKLIYDVVVNSALVDYFHHGDFKSCKSFIANTAHLDFDFNGNSYLIKNELVNWIESVGNFRIGDIETGGSVATSAFHFAFLLGGNPIILVGQDLAYTAKASHSPSTSHLYKTFDKLHRLKTLESVFLQVMQTRKAFPIRDLEPEIYTDFVLHNFRGWFEESAKNIRTLNQSIGLFNATQNHTPIRYFDSVGLSDLCRQIRNNYQQKIDKSKLLHLKLIETRKFDKIIGAICEWKKYLQGFGAIDNGIFETMEKSRFAFVKSYFMRERVLFEKYGNLDKENIERKLSRLIKNLEGVMNR